MSWFRSTRWRKTTGCRLHHPAAIGLASKQSKARECPPQCQHQKKIKNHNFKKKKEEESNKESNDEKREQGGQKEEIVVAAVVSHDNTHPPTTHILVSRTGLIVLGKPNKVLRVVDSDRFKTFHAV